MPRWRHFNECIGIDIMDIPDLTTQQHAVLIITDLASDKTAAEYCCKGARATAAQVKSAFDRAWLSWAGLPSHGVQFDLDTSFAAEFGQLLEDLGLAQVPVALEAHWQAGKVERKIQFLKEMRKTVFAEQEVLTGDAVNPDPAPAGEAQQVYSKN